MTLKVVHSVIDSEKYLLFGYKLNYNDIVTASRTKKRVINLNKCLQINIETNLDDSMKFYLEKSQTFLKKHSIKIYAQRFYYKNSTHRIIFRKLSHFLEIRMHIQQIYV